MVRHPPLVVDDQWLLPAYDESANQSVILRSDARREQWDELYRFEENYLIQPDLVRLDARTLTLIFRPQNENTLWRSDSSDKGNSWDKPIQLPLSSAQSGLDAIALNDSIALVWNNTDQHKRTPLSLSFGSLIGGRFSDPVDIDTSPFEVSYPSFVVDDSGTVHGVYTFNRRMIKYVSFDESWAAAAND